MAWSLLLLPSAVVETLGLSTLRQQHRPWIGIAALLSTVWLLSFPTFRVGKWIERRYLAWRLPQVGRRVLAQLTSVEKAYLKLYIDGDTLTQEFSFSDGVAQRRIFFQGGPHAARTPDSGFDADARRMR